VHLPNFKLKPTRKLNKIIFKIKKKKHKLEEQHDSSALSSLLSLSGNLKENSKARVLFMLETLENNDKTLPF
jgi:hypothetical protein